MSKLTIDDIAAMAKVSHTTVSRALNGATNVKPETYQRIMSICEQTGYTLNANASRLKSRKTNTIGIVVRDIATDFASQSARRIEYRARKLGYTVFILSSFDYSNEEKNILTLLQNRVEGIIIAGVGEDSYVTIQKYANRVPIFCLGDNVPEEGFSYATIDNRHGMSLAVNYLLSLGHRRFVFFGGRDSSMAHRRRKEGFLEEIRRHPQAEYEVFTRQTSNSIESGRQTAGEYFRRGDAATAGLCISDNYALGVMQAAEENGVDVPRDFSLVGFNDLSFAALPRIQLTTVTQPLDELCNYALDTLLKMIEGDRQIVSNIIRPTLAIRSTCAPPDENVNCNIFV